MLNSGSDKLQPTREHKAISDAIQSPRQSACLTLVPNSRRLQARVADAFRSQPQRRVLVAPPVAVFSQWVEDLALRIALLEGCPVPATANPQRLAELWEASAPTDLAVLATAERSLAARRAREADRLLTNGWPAGEPAGLASQFQDWRRRVHARLERDGLSTPEAWLLRLATRLEHSEPLPLKLPGEIAWDGFSEFTALEQRLLDALRRRGVRLECPAPASEPGAVAGLFGFASLAEELAAAANWAQVQWAAGHERIAVVVNGLDAEAGEVRRRFENVFSAAQRAKLQETADAPFHVSRGEPLAEHPVIADALLLLSLSVDGLDRPQAFARLSRWLLSPYWRDAETERAGRAHLELRLRRDGRFRRSPLDALRAAGPELAALRDGLQRLADLAASEPPEPARFFLDCLTAWGWPGPAGIGADGGRYLSRFNGLLERLAELQPRGPRQALAVLRRMCAEARVLLRGSPLSPVQILSPQDAAGRRFDAAWIANLHEGNWPRQALNNPWLPASLLREIPRATPAGELAWCERLTAALKGLAPELRFSWSRQAGGVPNGVSPVLADLPRHDGDPPAAPDPRTTNWRDYAGNPWLREVDDGPGLALAAAGDGRAAQPIPGGAGMLGDQSACPLMAYLKHRLRARFDDMPGPFADAAYRGELMHAALQELYREPADSASALPATFSDEPLRQAVERALQSKHAALRLLPVSREAERRRLVALLHEWLALESARPRFTVQALEQRIDASLLGHPLSLRADRIDRLADGRLMIIDYKSSGGSISGWSQERLRQPQLPLYAALLERESDARVGAIALATVRGGECALAGIAADPLIACQGMSAFDSRRPAHAQRFADWEALLAHWSAGVDALAAEIAAGRADNVVYDRKALSWSGLNLLLRREEGEAWRLAHGDATGDTAGVPS